ncbi:dinuclear metal center protein [Thermoclostridium stercorarium subsp. leptospartum DSM 9219]|uniref:GTP cyclohydrolase 1 type 2 homolog n=1 Tax=Thermoclostridium stercorarium subsp. leptospartum DSM 9219 TaxID=1346611 RepID=A0A1B1YIZ9_THEST|nr:Nif3-like dinuclear metal center hexameric protein [Thermoclostridium stercorarium]ANX00747.1 dinuclear metal center protein [Thermoclostridium stercorarium subsp. leptospartum DSM 9219]
MIILKCRDIINILENEAPLKLQEDYDNSGLQWGNPEDPVQKVLVCLDFTPDALRNAVENKVQLVISHHPVLFRPLRTINTAAGKGAMIAECIKNDISVYSLHTNFDTADNGLNEYLAKTLELQDITGLKKHYRDDLYKLVVFVPEESLQKVQKAIFDAGGGYIGNYSDCSFSAPGTGTFRPLEGSNPYIGQAGIFEKVKEYRLEVLVPESKLRDVVKNMLEAHPYEEVAYDIYQVEQPGHEYSLGRVGTLREKLSCDEFVLHVKEKLNVHNVRTVGRIQDAEIQRVAVFCGSFDGDVKVLKDKNVDALVTGDLKYHTAQELEDAGIFTVDAGHYHTEKLFIKAISDILKNRLKDVIIVEHYGNDIFDFR